ncbi:MAG: FAD-dependent oxidoreductase [Actinomycetota bacterium]|nr:FAD-dependent oxidoreductase [Actinomycetota bacterium]
MQTVAIVGASLAGISAARALRSQGYGGRLVIVGDEPERPYDRPPLSKDFLAGRITSGDLSLETPEEDLDAEWLLGVAATRLDVQGRVLTLGDGTEVRFDAVVLATGSHARTLPEVSGMHNVHTLRTVGDARRLREQLSAGRRLVVVGAGFIGAEVASTARSLGLDVTIIGADAVPLTAPLGAVMGAHIAGLHQAHGVRLICGARVESFALLDDAVTAVRLADGREVPADVVVLGIGGVPNVGWLQGSGLDLADGIRCDAAGRTNVSGIVAVGDCAAWWDERSGVYSRLEHWTGALERPAVAAAALLADLSLLAGVTLLADPELLVDPALLAGFTLRDGVPPLEAGAAAGAPVLKPPYFWSDQYGIRLQFAGTAQLADRVQIEAGDPADFSFLAVYYRGEEAVAVLGANQPRLFTRWRKTLEKGRLISVGDRSLVPTLAVS